MTDRKKDMQIIFNELSEKNKDIMLLVAKGMKAAKENTEQIYVHIKPMV